MIIHVRKVVIFFSIRALLKFFWFREATATESLEERNDRSKHLIIVMLLYWSDDDRTIAKRRSSRCWKMLMNHTTIKI